MRKYVSMLAFIIGCSNSQQVSIEEPEPPVVEIGDGKDFEIVETYTKSDKSLRFLVRELDHKMKERGIEMILFSKIEKDGYMFFVENSDKNMYFGMGFPRESNLAIGLSDDLPLGSLDRTGYSYKFDLHGDFSTELNMRAYKIMIQICLNNFDDMKHPFNREDGKLVEQKHALRRYGFLPSPEYLEVALEMEDYVYSRHPNK